jgi:CRISPR system Cascade subunit CasA
MPEFNLLKEDWIPCIGGKRPEYGIRDALLSAHEVREICDDSPLVTVAIHRLLLAILYRAFEGPSDMAKWRSLYKKGRFAPDEEIDKYVDHWWSRFYLFDEQHPFMQVAGLDLNKYMENGEVKDDKSDGLMRLVREAPDKGGRILFDHRVGTERPEYEPRQIARMILAAQSYSGTGVASGGKVGKQQIKPTPCQFAPCVEGLVLWLQGDTLFHTLLLNLVPRDHVANDKPAWEDDSIVDAAIKSWAKPVTSAGPVQRFAALSRFIRLTNRKEMFFTNGLKTGPDSDDPMKAYSRPDVKQPFQAVKLRKDKAAWRDAHTLLSLGSSARKPPASLNHMARLVFDATVPMSAHPRANVVGLATDQGKALLWRHERMPVPAALFAGVDVMERLGVLLQNAEQTADELHRRTRRIVEIYLAPDAESPDGRQPDPEEVKRLAGTRDEPGTIDPRPAYWARLENHFFELLKSLPLDWDAEHEGRKPDDQQAATNTWRDRVKAEARRALEESIRSLGTTARAIRAVARVRTDFNDSDLIPPPRTAAKAKPKSKGGKKK